MPIKFAVKIVRLKVYNDHCQSNDLGLHSRSQKHLKLDYFLTYNIYLGHYTHWLSITFKLGMKVDLCMAYNRYMLMLIFMTLNLTLKTFVRFVLLSYCIIISLYFYCLVLVPLLRSP